MTIYPFNKRLSEEESNKYPTDISDTLVKEWEDVRGKNDLLNETIERLIAVKDDEYEFNNLPAEDRTSKVEYLLSEEIDRLILEDMKWYHEQSNL